MANADRNDLKKSRIRADRNEREDAPVQPGATGRDPEEPVSEEEVKRATRTYGKTGKTV